MSGARFPSGVRYVALLLVLIAVAACGGGGGGGSGGGFSGGSGSSSSSSSSSAVANSVAITVEAWPSTASGNVNVPYTTVTLCVPGTATCQVIDHIIVDTGSVGLRIEREALDATLLAGLPQTMNGTTPIGECYQYVDGYVFGSVRTADFAIGGEQVANLPLMVIADSGPFATVPTSCSSSGGSGHQTVADFGAKGIIGIGNGITDCSRTCYYNCPSAGNCTSVPSAVAVPVVNPVAQMAVDNNGTIVVLPAVAVQGQQTLTGTLIFGIGTRANNGLGGRTPLTTSASGKLTATYNGQALNNSFTDTGTNFLGFTDAAITQCTGGLKGFYCPATPLTISATLTGNNGATTGVSLPINNLRNFNGNFAVLPGVGGDPTAFSNLTPFSNSFDFGLPFFYGRSVYTAIGGRNADGVVGPYIAF